jgi:uncharacterized protein (DUF1501 family)
MTHKTTPHRRQFLKTAMAAGLGAAAWAPWLQMQAMAQSASASSGNGEYKALVCLFLFGGNDGNNLLLPYEPNDYALYSRARSNLALDRSSVLPITPLNTSGHRYALHPALTQTKALFDAGQAAVLANVGPLVVPTSKTDFERRRVPLPPNLFSHSDQQNAWQTDNIAANVRGGWGGRMVERLVDQSTVNRSYSCVSVSGSALWGMGDGTLVPYRVPPSGRFGLDFFTPGGADPLSVALTGLMAETRSDVFETAWLQSMRRAMDNQQVLASALNANTLKSTFPGTDLGDQLAMIARLIHAREALGLKRQCFFCSIGGFDTHGEDQLAVQQDKFSQIDAAIAAFQAEMQQASLGPQVTLFTASDFGRTLVSNSRGSDHGWGNHHLVFGGAVRGQRLYGSFPDHTVDGRDDIGNGNFIPALSLDEFGADLARWFGAESSIAQVFPQAGNFSADLNLMAV